MICVADEISLLTRQEQQLHQSKGNLRGQRSLVKKQPNLLQIDGTVLEKIIAVKIVGKCEEAGKSFTLGGLLERGAVETTDEMVFEREEWLLVEVLITAANQNYKLISNFDTTPIIKPEI